MEQLNITHFPTGTATPEERNLRIVRQHQAEVKRATFEYILQRSAAVKLAKDKFQQKYEEYTQKKQTATHGLEIERAILELKEADLKCFETREELEKSLERGWDAGCDDDFLQYVNMRLM